MNIGAMLLSVSLTVGCGCPGERPADQRPPGKGADQRTAKEERAKLQTHIWQLISLRHGLRPESGRDVAAQIEEACSNPIEYTPEIERMAEAQLLVIRGEATKESLKCLGIEVLLIDLIYGLGVMPSAPEAVRRIGLAVELLDKVNPPSAVTLAGEAFVTIEPALQRESENLVRAGMKSRQMSMLDRLGDHVDRRVVSLILKQLPQWDDSKRSDALDYLKKVSVGDRDVIGRLEEFARDRDSPLHNDQTLLDAVTALKHERGK